MVKSRMIAKNGRQPFSAVLTAKAVLSAAARDLMGDTLGSFSALAVDPASWQRSRGGVSVKLFTLPDRGFNTPEKGE
jgi:N-acetylglutamate synthase-like GNAT family acetyltransferase